VLASTSQDSKPAEALADSPSLLWNPMRRVLDSHKEIQIKDAHTMVLTAKYSKAILNYAAKNVKPR
jgi:hypothetical protein